MENPDTTSSEPEPDESTTPGPRKPAVDARTILEQHVQKSRMQKRASIRAAISLGVIAVLAFAGWKIIPQIVNSDPGTFASAGYIVALKQVGEESQAVMVSPDGKLSEAPDHKGGSTDQYPIWGPDGQRIYFISDRENQEPHIFRWNPNPGKLLGLLSRPSVERRSVDSRAKTRLSFEVPAGDDSETSLLISGGTVLEFDPKKGESFQVLPPSKMQTTSQNSEEGEQGQFDAIYAKYGTGFIDARWQPNKSVIAATMRMEDGGVLFLQQTMIGDPKPPTVFPLAGDAIEFDIDPVNGDVVLAITNCRYVAPEFIPKEAIVDNKVKMPFRHVILHLGSQGSIAPLIASQDDRQCYSKPKISPQGMAAGLTAIFGSYDDVGNRQVPQALMLLGPIAQTEGNTKGLASGKIYESSWHPNGTSVVFTMYVERNKKISICSMNLDGSNSKVLTGPEADYRYPVVSPTLQ